MMHHRPSDPDADRPCSCEESLQLKAAALELQNQLMAMAEEKAAAEAAASELRGQYAEKSEALILAETRAIAAESDANVNRLKLEEMTAWHKRANEHRLEALTGKRLAEARVRELEAENQRLSDETWNLGTKAETAESEARALREGLQKERAAHGREKFNHEATWNDRNALRERIERAIPLLVAAAQNGNWKPVLDALEALRGS